MSKEPGKHLLEAEDLLQKHGLLEADIAAQTERVRALNAAALRFSELEGDAARLGRLGAVTAALAETRVVSAQVTSPATPRSSATA